jgi:serine/threonine-protein kinase RIO1
LARIQRLPFALARGRIRFDRSARHEGNPTRRDDGSASWQSKAAADLRQVATPGVVVPATLVRYNKLISMHFIVRS